MSLSQYKEECASFKDSEDEVLSNLRYVISVARKYARNETELMDYIQDGNEGMLLAQKLFDPSKGVKFLTYAGYHVTDRIREAQRTMNGPVSISRNKYVERYMVSTCMDSDSVLEAMPAQHDHDIDTENLMNGNHMKSLTNQERDAAMLVLHHGLNGADVGRVMGYTNQRIHQFIQSVTKKLAAEF